MSDLDLQYSHNVINSVSCLHLPTFRSQASIVSENSTFLAHLSRRLVGELIVVYQWSGVRQSSFAISNMNISATSGRIANKFYLKHHWVRGKDALGFEPYRISTLVSMATESSHRVIMEKTMSPLFLGCFSSDPFHTCRQ